MSIDRTFGTRRYRVLEQLGGGTMGEIYRAYDRLTGQDVALKRVMVTPHALAFDTRPSTNDPQALLLALAHEFRTLAALRHPHIISVLDYGFDANRQPFFTMELLKDAGTLLEAGAGQPLAGKVELLIQVCEALAYLHRRGILHHDLKPANVLVAGGRVRLLDFGLAVTTSQKRDHDTFGTLLYLPPEVIDGAPYTPAGDLYSLGVIAYELLVGHHPFAVTALDSFLDQVLYDLPDLAPLAAHPDLAALIGQLLAKTPDARPASAHVAIAALRRVVGQAFKRDSIAIRESYLQAATFVGREREMASLRAALDRMQSGASELWLIGGESGVGKSRLLDELRAEALVAGVLVTIGYALEGGGPPYQLWREPLRRLVLEAKLSDLEASVLKALVPDIGTLLGQEVPDAPELSGDAARTRLHLTVAELLGRLERPLLLLLEDLQWTSESLALLNDVRRQQPNAPLLVVGTYRDDERPDLPDTLPGAQPIRLERLGADAVADLSRAMLGPAGAQPHVLKLLQRESEGNSFFLVEVVRALAEEAGGLEAVGQAMLPATIFPGGMQQIVRRRLAQVPAWAQELLRQAAVAGRQIDLAVLARLAPDTTDLDAWLRAGADAAVLELADAGWRFAHDKLREMLLADMPADERTARHRQVAEAIEAVYTGERDRAIYAEALLEHWRQARDPARALDYALILARELIDYSADHDRAAALLDLGEQLAAQAPDAPRDGLRLRLGVLRGHLLFMRARYDEALAQQAHTLALARALGDIATEAETLCEYSTTAAWSGHLAEAEPAARASLALARTIGDQHLIGRVMRVLGRMTHWSGQYEQAVLEYREGLAAASAGGDQRTWSALLSDLADLALDRGDTTAALADYQECLAISETIGDRRNSAIARADIGGCLHALGELEQARICYEQSAALCRVIGDWGTLAIALGRLGDLADVTGDPAAALNYYQQAVAAAQTDGNPYYLVQVLNRLVIAQARLRDPQARATLLQMLQMLAPIDLIRFKLDSLVVAACVAWAAGRPQLAAELRGLLAAAPEATAEQRQGVPWLQQELQAALNPSELEAAAARGAARDLRATLDELQDWLAAEEGA